MGKIHVSALTTTPIRLFSCCKLVNQNSSVMNYHAHQNKVLFLKFNNNLHVNT